MDKISKQQRSWNMSRIKSKDTAPELRVRKILHKAGYRYRLYSKNLPGKPDIVFNKFQTAVFIHGCFWHHHKGCKGAYFPKSNIKYWLPKIRRNIQRDKIIVKQLSKEGWRVIIIWECQTYKDEEILKAFSKQLITERQRIV
ncbi:MAG: DNA mismatch endonuclease Vsr [Candidatus Omnitrophica bacterium]|nr:DNA mismatch endonuclease Vsr [Candidatus Omnitrophota bacterium]